MPSSRTSGFERNLNLAEEGYPVNHFGFDMGDSSIRVDEPRIATFSTHILNVDQSSQGQRQNPVSLPLAPKLERRIQI